MALGCPCHCCSMTDALSTHIDECFVTGAWVKVAPLRILSVDIECAGRKVRLS